MGKAGRNRNWFSGGFQKFCQYNCACYTDRASKAGNCFLFWVLSYLHSRDVGADSLWMIIYKKLHGNQVIFKRGLVFILHFDVIPVHGSVWMVKGSSPIQWESPVCSLSEGVTELWLDFPFLKTLVLLRLCLRRRRMPFISSYSFKDGLKSAVRFKFKVI